jgi:predicted RNase H-like nuclease (RuvC/YqgF family)
MSEGLEAKAKTVKRYALFGSQATEECEIEEDEDGEYVTYDDYMDAQKEIERQAKFDAGIIADYKKEIQKLKDLYEDLHSDFISQSESWQKTINKNKVLEGRLSRIRSLIKELRELNPQFISPKTAFKVADWLESLEKELKET